MNSIQSGTYTTDKSDLYMKVSVKYRSPKGYFKAKVSLYYKYSTYKDQLIETGKYKIYYKNITHWKEWEISNEQV